jgi:hypothetical protein
VPTLRLAIPEVSRAARTQAEEWAKFLNAGAPTERSTARRRSDRRAEERRA